MSRLCLDTSAYSQFKRGSAAVVSVLDAAREVVVPSIVLGELRAGFRLGSRAATNEAELDRFLAQGVVAVAEVDDEAASHYADLIGDLRRQGTPLPINDVWIAAVALREGATVLTCDAHFAKMRRVGALILEG